MRSRTTRTGRGVAVALGAAALLALAGCGPVNRGSGLADEVEAALRDAPGVAEVDAGGVNPLPWSGTAGAVVRLHPDASRADAVAVVERAAALVQEADGDLAIALAQDVAGTATELALDPRRDPADQLDDRDAVAALLAGGGSVTLRPAGVPVGSGGYVSTSARNSVDATVGDPAAAAGLVAGLGTTAAWADADVAVGLPDGSALTAKPASSPSAALLADLVAAGVPVRSGSLNGTAAWLRVDDGAVEAARAVAAARPDLRVTVAGTTVPAPTATPTPAS